MNNQGKNLFERALETEIQFGTHRSPNVIVIKKAVLNRRNFAGKDVVCKDRKGKTFTRKGRRFTLILTEDLFNALSEVKGECTYGIWEFAKEENPDLKVYTIDVNVKMESANPPKCELYTKYKGDIQYKLLDSTNIGVLDEIAECDIDRVDLELNAYDPDKTGHFTLWLRSIKFSQLQIEDADEYWTNLTEESDKATSDVSGDPNNEQ